MLGCFFGFDVHEGFPDFFAEFLGICRDLVTTLEGVGAMFGG